MSYPSYSYLTPGVLEMALDLARHLRQAAEDISNLTDGGSVAYSYAVGGRSGDKAVAVKDWVGPHHDTFEQLFDNELGSAGETRTKLGEEADAWAQFWATATNARNARLYDAALDTYNVRMTAYNDQVDQYQAMVEEDPDNAPNMYIGMPPPAPARAAVVTAPTHATDYQPTG
jgi:hypothetical protein